MFCWKTILFSLKHWKKSKRNAWNPTPFCNLRYRKKTNFNLWKNWGHIVIKLYVSTLQWSYLLSRLLNFEINLEIRSLQGFYRGILIYYSAHPAQVQQLYGKFGMFWKRTCHIVLDSQRNKNCVLYPRTDQSNRKVKLTSVQYFLFEEKIITWKCFLEFCFNSGTYWHHYIIVSCSEFF